MIEFIEEPIWYPIYADTNNNEFEKSTLLDELDEGYYYDEDGIKRKRKGYNLKDLEISEISLCRAGKVNAGKYLIQKGDGNEMEKQMTTGEIKTIQTVVNILKKRKVTGDLLKAQEILEKYFPKGAYPYPYPSKVKKSTPKWTSAQRAIFGYTDEDLEKCDYEEEGEIEKSSDDNPFPSLSRVFNRNQRNVEEFIEDENIEERFI